MEQLRNTMCCAIFEWFEIGHVPLCKYTEKLHYKKWSQGAKNGDIFPI